MLGSLIVQARRITGPSSAASRLAERGEAVGGGGVGPAALGRDPAGRREVVEGDHRVDAGVEEGLATAAGTGRPRRPTTRPPRARCGSTRSRSGSCRSRSTGDEGDVVGPAVPRCRRRRRTARRSRTPSVCSQAHQSLFQLPPSIWWAAVAVPQVNPSGKRRGMAMHPRWRCRATIGMVVRRRRAETWDRGPIVEQDAVDGLVRAPRPRAHRGQPLPRRQPAGPAAAGVRRPGRRPGARRRRPHRRRRRRRRCTRCTPTSCAPATRRCRSSTRSTASATAAASPPAASSPSSTARPIFHLAASFHVAEPGMEHQAPMPDDVAAARVAPHVQGALGPARRAARRVVHPPPPDRLPQRRLGPRRPPSAPLAPASGCG